MKKIILFFTLYLFLSLKISFAQVCLIEEKTAPFLDDYIKNTRDLLSEINTQAMRDNSKKKIKIQKDKIYQEIVKAYNQTFNVNYTIANIRFGLELPKTLEIPKEVKRDFEKLKQIRGYITENFENIMLDGKGNVKIKDICKNFSDLKCNIKNDIKIYDLMIQILNNHRNIETIYLEEILGNNVTKYPLFIVKEGFYRNLAKYYSKASFSECNKKEGTLFGNVMKKSKELENTNNSIENGIKKWKEARNLLLGIDMSQEKINKVERELLRKKLEEDGIYGTNQENILSSLDKFNQDGQFSLENNFVTNTFYNIISTVKKSINEIKQELLADFIDKNQDKRGEIPIKSITKARKNLIKTNSTQEKIESFYANESIFAINSDINASNLRARLINTHLYLRDSIDTLSKNSCKKAVKICNQQDSGRGKCGVCR